MLQESGKRAVIVANGRQSMERRKLLAPEERQVLLGVPDERGV